LWRCHVVGRDIQKAGLLGQVLGTVPLDKEHLKTLFRSAGAQLPACSVDEVAYMRPSPEVGRHLLDITA
jgi:hypothetical protein